MAKVTRWQQAIARKNQRALLRLIQEQDAAIRKAVAKAARAAGGILDGMPSNKVGAIIRRAFYEQRRAALIRLSQDLWGNIGTGVLNGIGQASVLGTKADEQVLRVLLRSLGRGQAATQLAESIIAAAQRTHADLVARFLNGVDLAPSVYKNQALMIGKIDTIVNNGILLGQSAAEIAEAVSTYINPQVNGGVRYAAHRLGRTELNNAFHTTSIMTYNESPYVEAVAWNLSGSHPEDDECDEFAESDDFGLGEGIYPPESTPDHPHPNCFCYLTPITPTPDEFQDKLLAGDYGPLEEVA